MNLVVDENEYSHSSREYVERGGAAKEKMTQMKHSRAIHLSETHL
jgi:hypothetical protein